MSQRRDARSKTKSPAASSAMSAASTTHALNDIWAHTSACGCDKDRRADGRGLRHERRSGQFIKQQDDH
jgi:hypothetical protein